MLNVNCIIFALIINIAGSQFIDEKVDKRRLCPCASNFHREFTRIVGGHNAGQGHFPYASCLVDYDNTLRAESISSFQENEKENVYSFCGATLVTDIHVLTAAHCFNQRSIDKILVDIADYDLKSTQDRRLRKVKSVTKFPTYHEGSFYTDIALVEFEPPVRWHSGVRTAILPDKDLHLAPGGIVSAFGWGRLNYTGGHPHLLQVVDLPIMESEVCQKHFKTHIEQHMICAGGIAGHDACIGDSGSGLVVREGNEYVLVGVVSFGIRCALPDVAGVYTRVPNFVDWILNNTRSSSCKPCEYKDTIDS